jgi:dihydrofolate reductase
MMSISPDPVRVGVKANDSEDPLITVVNHITLDGVMQSPMPEEGFEHAGWAEPYADDVLGEYMGRRMAAAGPGAMLFGRRTFEHMEAGWRNAPRDSQFTRPMNEGRKYVASRTLTEDPDWNNSVLLRGDVVDAVQEIDEDVVILGSGSICRALFAADLIDTWVLTINPIVLGSGLRLFPDGGAFGKLELMESVPTTTGVLIARYERSK